MITKRTKPAQELMQVLLDNPNIKDVVINWSRRGGKTTYVVSDIIKTFAYAIENAHITFCTTTLKHAKDIAWQVMLSELKPFITHKNVGEGTMRIRNKWGGESVISLYGWQTIENIRGTHNDIVIYDETQLLGEFFSYHNTAVAPTMATTKGRRFYLGTPQGFNHFYELKETALSDPDWYYSEADWTQFKHIDIDFIEKEKLRLTKAEFSQEYENKFVKPDGLVLNSFDHEIHVYEGDVLGKQKRVIVGVDFGYGKGNTAILKVVQDENNKLWVEQETYKEGMSLRTFELAKIIGDMKPDIVYADSADPTRVIDLSRTGLPVEPIKKHNNYKHGLISRVNQVIERDQLAINKECKNLLSEVGMFYWAEHKDMVRPDNSTKHDAIDALLYAVGSIEETFPQQKVIAKTKKKKLAVYRPALV